MIGGSVIVVLCLLTLGYTAEIVGVFVKRQDTVGHDILPALRRGRGVFLG